MPKEFERAALGTKAERMDRWMRTVGRRPSASDLIQLIELIYGFDMDTLPASPTQGSAREVIEGYLEECGSSGLSGSSGSSDSSGSSISGRELRQRLNLAFGVNLDALSALEGERISLYSKNQWMLRDDTDLFIVHTGKGDVDVRIYPTPYFWLRTKAEALPDDFMHDMLILGYDFDEGTSSHYYCSPGGEAVPDEFKGKTIHTLRRMIARSFSGL